MIGNNFQLCNYFKNVMTHRFLKLYDLCYDMKNRRKKQYITCLRSNSKMYYKIAYYLFLKKNIKNPKIHLFLTSLKSIKIQIMKKC